MAHLRQRDLLALIDFVQEAYAPRNPEGFVDHLLCSLPRLVPADGITYDEIDPRRRHTLKRRLAPASLVLPGIDEAFTRHVHEHPLVRHNHHRHDGGDVVQIADFLSRRKFHKLGLYHELFRPLRIEAAIVCPMPASLPVIIGAVLMRTRRDFSERDRALLDFARPHLLRAYRNAEIINQMRQQVEALEASDQGVLILRRDHRIQWINARAARWLGEYFEHPDPHAMNGRLPEILLAWVREQYSRVGTTIELSSRPAPLVIQRERGRLAVRLIPAARLLILQEQRTTVEPAALAHLGVTRREAEVLTWLTCGKTNTEIAAILGCSARTVQKHLERIYVKLNVGTRTAAVARVLQRDSEIQSTKSFGRSRLTAARHRRGPK